MNTQVLVFLCLLVSSVPVHSEPLGCGEGQKSEWFHVSTEQTDPSQVEWPLESYERPKRTKCIPAVFTESGLDVVTESEWVLVLAVIIGPEGNVERFRFIRKPQLNIAYRKPLIEALGKWRFEPLKRGGQSVAACDILVLHKPMGFRASSCGESNGGDA